MLASDHGTRYGFVVVKQLRRGVNAALSKPRTASGRFAPARTLSDDDAMSSSDSVRESEHPGWERPAQDKPADYGDHGGNADYPPKAQAPNGLGAELDPSPAEDTPPAADVRIPDGLPRGESRDRPPEESAESSGPRSSGEDFRGNEAATDLREAQKIIRVIIDLVPVDGPGKAVTLEVRVEADAVARLLDGIAGVLASGGSPSAGQVCAVILRVEMLQASAEEAVRHADGDVKEVLEKVLGKIPMIGQKLVSMSLHLFPVKEWSLGCEVSAVLVKGSISVTFGK
jgi:hypothetical protein